MVETDNVPRTCKLGQASTSKLTRSGLEVIVEVNEDELNEPFKPGRVVTKKMMRESFYNHFMPGKTKVKKKGRDPETIAVPEQDFGTSPKTTDFRSAQKRHFTSRSKNFVNQHLESRKFRESIYTRLEHLPDLEILQDSYTSYTRTNFKDGQRRCSIGGIYPEMSWIGDNLLLQYDVDDTIKVSDIIDMYQPSFSGNSVSMKLCIKPTDFVTCLEMKDQSEYFTYGLNDGTVHVGRITTTTNRDFRRHMKNDKSNIIFSETVATQLKAHVTNLRRGEHDTNLLVMTSCPNYIPDKGKASVMNLATPIKAMVEFYADRPINDVAWSFDSPTTIMFACQEAIRIADTRSTLYAKALYTSTPTKKIAADPSRVHEFMTYDGKDFLIYDIRMMQRAFYRIDALNVCGPDEVVSFKYDRRFNSVLHLNTDCRILVLDVDHIFASELKEYRSGEKAIRKKGRRHKMKLDFDLSNELILQRDITVQWPKNYADHLTKKSVVQPGSLYCWLKEDCTDKQLQKQMTLGVEEDGSEKAITLKNVNRRQPKIQEINILDEMTDVTTMTSCLNPFPAVLRVMKETGSLEYYEPNFSKIPQPIRTEDGIEDISFAIRCQRPASMAKIVKSLTELRGKVKDESIPLNEVAKTVAARHKDNAWSTWLRNAAEIQYGGREFYTVDEDDVGPVIEAQPTDAQSLGNVIHESTDMSQLCAPLLSMFYSQTSDYDEDEAVDLTIEDKALREEFIGEKELKDSGSVEEPEPPPLTLQKKKKVKKEEKVIEVEKSVLDEEEEECEFVWPSENRPSIEPPPVEEIKIVSPPPPTPSRSAQSSRRSKFINFVNKPKTVPVKEAPDLIHQVVVTEPPRISELKPTIMSRVNLLRYLRQTLKRKGVTVSELQEDGEIIRSHFEMQRLEVRASLDQASRLGCDSFWSSHAFETNFLQFFMAVVTEGPEIVNTERNRSSAAHIIRKKLREDRKKRASRKTILLKTADQKPKRPSSAYRKFKRSSVLPRNSRFKLSRSFGSVPISWEVVGKPPAEARINEATNYTCHFALDELTDQMDHKQNKRKEQTMFQKLPVFKVKRRKKLLELEKMDTGLVEKSEKIDSGLAKSSEKGFVENSKKTEDGPVKKRQKTESVPVENGKKTESVPVDNGEKTESSPVEKRKKKKCGPVENSERDSTIIDTQDYPLCRLTAVDPSIVPDPERIFESHNARPLLGVNVVRYQPKFVKVKDIYDDSHMTLSRNPLVLFPFSVENDNEQSRQKEDVLRGYEAMEKDVVEKLPMFSFEPLSFEQLNIQKFFEANEHEPNGRLTKVFTCTICKHFPSFEACPVCNVMPKRIPKCFVHKKEFRLVCAKCNCRLIVFQCTEFVTVLATVKFGLTNEVFSFLLDSDSEEEEEEQVVNEVDLTPIAVLTNEVSIASFDKMLLADTKPFSLLDSASPSKTRFRTIQWLKEEKNRKSNKTFRRNTIVNTIQEIEYKHTDYRTKYETKEERLNREDLEAAVKRDVKVVEKPVDDDSDEEESEVMPQMENVLHMSTEGTSEMELVEIQLPDGSTTMQWMTVGQRRKRKHRIKKPDGGMSDNNKRGSTKTSDPVTAITIESDPTAQLSQTPPVLAITSGETSSSTIASTSESKTKSTAPMPERKPSSTTETSSSSADVSTRNTSALIRSRQGPRRTVSSGIAIGQRDSSHPVVSSEVSIGTSASSTNLFNLDAPTSAASERRRHPSGSAPTRTSLMRSMFSLVTSSNRNSSGTSNTKSLSQRMGLSFSRTRASNTSSSSVVPTTRSVRPSSATTRSNSAILAKPTKGTSSVPSSRPGSASSSTNRSNSTSDTTNTDSNTRNKLRLRFPFSFSPEKKKKVPEPKKEKTPPPKEDSPEPDDTPFDWDEYEAEMREDEFKHKAKAVPISQLECLWFLHEDKPEEPCICVFEPDKYKYSIEWAQAEEMLQVETDRPYIELHDRHLCHKFDEIGAALVEDLIANMEIPVNTSFKETYKNWEHTTVMPSPYPGMVYGSLDTAFAQLEAREFSTESFHPFMTEVLVYQTLEVEDDYDEYENRKMRTKMQALVKFRELMEGNTYTRDELLQTFISFTEVIMSRKADETMLNIIVPLLAKLVEDIFAKSNEKLFSFDEYPEEKREASTKGDSWIYARAIKILSLIDTTYRNDILGNHRLPSFLILSNFLRSSSLREKLEAEKKEPIFIHPTHVSNSLYLDRNVVTRLEPSVSFEAFSDTFDDSIASIGAIGTLPNWLQSTSSFFRTYQTPNLIRRKIHINTVNCNLPLKWMCSPERVPDFDFEYPPEYHRRHHDSVKEHNVFKKDQELDLESREVSTIQSVESGFYYKGIPGLLYLAEKASREDDVTRQPFLGNFYKGFSKKYKIHSTPYRHMMLLSAGLPVARSVQNMLSENRSTRAMLACMYIILVHGRGDLMPKLSKMTTRPPSQRRRRSRHKEIVHVGNKHFVVLIWLFNKQRRLSSKSQKQAKRQHLIETLNHFLTNGVARGRPLPEFQACVLYMRMVAKRDNPHSIIPSLLELGVTMDLKLLYLINYCSNDTIVASIEAVYKTVNGLNRLMFTGLGKHPQTLAILQDYVYTTSDIFTTIQLLGLARYYDDDNFDDRWVYRKRAYDVASAVENKFNLSGVFRKKQSTSEYYPSSGDVNCQLDINQFEKSIILMAEELRTISLGFDMPTLSRLATHRIPAIFERPNPKVVEMDFSCFYCRTPMRKSLIMALFGEKVTYSLLKSTEKRKASELFMSETDYYAVDEYLEPEFWEGLNYETAQVTHASLVAAGLLGANMTKPELMEDLREQIVSMNACYNCRKSLPKCSVCRHGYHLVTIPYDGLHEIEEFTFCTICSHGGHITHMIDWFRVEEVCAVAECKCRCTELSNTLAGAMDRLVNISPAASIYVKQEKLNNDKLSPVQRFLILLDCSSKQWMASNKTVQIYLPK